MALPEKKRGTKPSHPVSLGRPRARMDAGAYDRGPLTAAEALEVERYEAAIRAKGGRWRVSGLRGALPRLVEPVLDAVDTLHFVPERLVKPEEFWRREARAHVLSAMVRGMHGTGIAYWSWKEEEWRRLAVDVRYRMLVLAVAYRLCGVHAYKAFPLPLSHCHLFQLLFGPEAWAEAEGRIGRLLSEWRYSVGDGSGQSRSHFTQTLAMALLDVQSPRVEDITLAALSELREREAWHSYIVPISRALRHMGVVPEHFKGGSGAKPSDDVWAGMAPEWAALVRRWDELAVCSDQHRKGLVNRCRQAGRWLHEHFPEAKRPEDWTPEIAAAYCAAVDRWTVGDYGTQNPYLGPHRVGKPLKPNTKAKLIANLRSFFRDLRRKKVVGPLQIDLNQDLETPKSIRRLLGPDPRDIRQAVWMKLVWASLNLTDEDCGTIPYPPTMIRALAVVWTHAGLRPDEIRRLRVGCVRDLVPGLDEDLREELGSDVADLVCLLDVPVNKTGGPFTKPVGKIVGQAVRAWEAERGEQPLLLDEKAAENVHFLFMARGMRLSDAFLNRHLIPLLCRKAGVPLEDVPGKPITAHRGRASAATWYYNTREGMTLEELQRWLGHDSIQTTRSYVRPSPIRAAQKFAKAHANGYMVEVLLDTEAVESGAAGRGKPWQYFPLGNGDFCSNPFYAQCPHRMACPKCSFHVPAASQAAAALKSKEGLQRMLTEMPLDDEERAAVEGGVEAMDGLVAKLRAVPTPDGRTPEDLRTSRGGKDE